MWLQINKEMQNPLSLSWDVQQVSLLQATGNLICSTGGPRDPNTGKFLFKSN